MSGLDSIFERNRRAFVRAMQCRSLIALLTSSFVITYFIVAAKWLEPGVGAPLWPARLAMEILGVESRFIVAAAIVGFFLLNLRPGWKSARLFSFVANLLIASLIYSRGKISHTLHTLLWIQFLFLFLPEWKRSPRELNRTNRQSFLLLVFAAQGTLLFFYSLAGLTKLIDGCFALWKGDMGSLSPLAMSYQIAHRVTETYSRPNGPQAFLLASPLAGYPIYLFTIFLQAFSIVVLFRPSLHRLWGIGLIAFHFATWALMGIFFPENVLLSAILLVGSPFHKKGSGNLLAPLFVTLRVTHVR